MRDLFPYKKLNWYPHLKPADILIWERFIDKYPDAFDTCQYDLGVGALPEFDVTVNPATGGSAAELYKRKIDVVGHKKGVVYVIEIKPRAGMSAIGQVEGYAHLYERDVAPGSDPVPVIITDVMDRDVGEIAAKKGIVLYFV